MYIAGASQMFPLHQTVLLSFASHLFSVLPVCRFNLVFSYLHSFVLSIRNTQIPEQRESLFCQEKASLIFGHAFHIRPLNRSALYQ